MAAPTGDSDLAILDRVLHRLVMTPDDKLEGVLTNLLPKLMDMLTTNTDAAVRNKVRRRRRTSSRSRSRSSRNSNMLVAVADYCNITSMIRSYN